MGDAKAARERLKAIKRLPLLDITQEVEDLAARIIASGIIPEKAGTDVLTSPSQPSIVPNDVELRSGKRHPGEGSRRTVQKSWL